jgi:hypothetical protein
MFSILCILCFCIILCTLSPFVYSCLFPIFVQVYRPLSPGGNPIAVNEYHISYQIFVRRNIKPIPHNRCHRRKSIHSKYYGGASLFFLQLPSMRIAPYLHPVTLPSVACLAVPYFFHITLRRNNFRAKMYGVRGGAVGLCTALQPERSQVRFPMGLLGFFSDLVLPAALRPWSLLSL